LSAFVSVSKNSYIVTSLVAGAFVLGVWSVSSSVF